MSVFWIGYVAGIAVGILLVFLIVIFVKKAVKKCVRRSWIKSHFGLYDLEDLEVGGHCGCCGAWMPKEIVPKWWGWSLCDECINECVE